MRCVPVFDGPVSVPFALGNYNPKPLVSSGLLERLVWVQNPIVFPGVSYLWPVGLKNLGLAGYVSGLPAF